MKYKILGPLIVLVASMVLMVFETSTCDIWFLPVIFTGIIISPTLLEWLTGKRELFDVEGLASAMLFQFMVVAPAVAFINDRYSLPMFDTRVLLGKTVAMCLPGLIAFQIGRKIGLGERIGIKAASSIRVLDISKARTFSMILISLGLIAHIFYLLKIRGATWGTRFSASTGLGYIVTIETLMYIGVLLVAVSSIQKYYNKINLDEDNSMAKPIFVLLIVFTVIMEQVLFRGSRGRIVMWVFWMMGIIHFSLKRVKLIYLIVPLILSAPLMQMYFMYKSFGSSAWRDYFDPAMRTRMAAASGGTLVNMFVGDLGRIGVWMFANQEISSGRFQHTWGKTYVEGSVVFIPRFIWPNRPHGMAEVVTDMVKGKGAYESTREKTARVAGLIGEAYINFGWPFVIVVMFLYGIIIKASSVWVQNLPNTSAKAFLVPFAILMVLYLFVWDWVWIVFKVFSMAIAVYAVYRITMPKYQNELYDNY